MTKKRAGARTEAARLLRIYGGDPSRWPGGVDGSAWRAACSDPALRPLMANAQSLDAVMEAAAPDAPDADFLKTLAATAPARSDHKQAGRVLTWRGLFEGLFPAAPAWAPASALILALFAGVFAGALMSDGRAEGDALEVLTVADAGGVWAEGR